MGPSSAAASSSAGVELHGFLGWLLAGRGAADVGDHGVATATQKASISRAEKTAGAAALCQLATAQFGGTESFFLWLLEQRRQEQMPGGEPSPSPPSHSMTTSLSAASWQKLLPRLAALAPPRIAAALPSPAAAAALFAHAALNGVLEGEEQSEAASCSEIRLREWRELLSFGQPRDGDGGMQLPPDERRPPVTVEYIGRHAEPISKALVKQVCLA